MERYNFNKTNSTGRRNRYLSESTSKEPRKTRSRLVSESAALKERAQDASTASKQPQRSLPPLHSHLPAPSFSLLTSASSKQHKAEKEERRCMLTASERKQRDIRDPEEELLRSVLVNNTMQHLNSDLRRERAAKSAKRSRAISRVRL